MTAKKITLTFNGTWVLSKRGESTLPVDVFVDALREAFGEALEITDTSLVSCGALIKSDALDNEQLSGRVLQILRECFSVEDLSSIASVEILDAVPIQETQKPTTEPTREQTPAPPPAETQKSARERVRALFGAEEFKTLCDELVLLAPALVEFGSQEVFSRQCYLFAINDGHGLTTCLNAFADLLEELSLFKFNKSERVREIKLPAPRPQDPVAALPSSAPGAQGGQLVCIDMTEWMRHADDQKLRDFLVDVQRCVGKSIYVFRVPFLEKDILDGISRTLADVMSIRTVSFYPFDFSELRAYADTRIKDKGFTMSEDAWDVLSIRIAEEKSDGRFYGFTTMDKVVCEMLYKKLLHDAQSGQRNRHVARGDILALTVSDSTEKSGLALLDDFIGIEDIKARVMEIVTQIETANANKALGIPCMHMRFVGNPGTGKTTIARVIGKILKEKGLLRYGNFFEYGGRDFCGRYVGETAPKTAAMCRDAYGSVLFIDEAYSLYREGESTVDYGREALDTLIAEMENHRGDMVVIMAGYPDDMEHLMKGNAGLASRMPFVIEFPNYTRHQLCDIFMALTRKSLAFSDGFEETVRNFFLNLSEQTVSAKEFANARFVRNLFERTWGKAAMRARLSHEDTIILTSEDFLAASADYDFQKTLNQKKKRALGF